MKSKERNCFRREITGLEVGLAGLLKKPELVNQARFDRFVSMMKTTVDSAKLDRYIDRCIVT